ncbi:Uncharacterised protein [Enterobacter cloacae]|uniref:Uncharacterized protein n=1 Tax=Enterobacter cloacae TaxID=550 RepID=A0A0M9IQW7_ENTCL|nr:hypothetical protein DR74_3427 [Enterobacter cloacae]CUJ36641.1 Uncharacterised protein [Enterobacter cloacae]STQ10063.1 Uncharacterised protein [Enterobacter cloacae]
MVIRKLALSSLRMIIFIGIFAIVSWLDVGYLTEHPLISNETAIRISYLFSNNPAPEDIYYSYDYTLIVFNVLISLFLYIVTMKLVKLTRSK